MKCIICLQERPDSNEHVIPKSLGGAFIIKRVCTTCNNSYCGSADAGLVTHYKIEQRRAELRLKGNNRKIPELLKSVLRRPIQTGLAREHSVWVKPDPDRVGSYIGRVVPKVVAEIVSDDAEGVAYRFPVLYLDTTDLPRAETLIRSALRKAGLRDELMLQGICDREIADLKESSLPTTFSVLVTVNAGGHALGMAKIAYEMAHHWLGDGWLEDPVAIELRSALRGDATAEADYVLHEDGADATLTGTYDATHCHLLIFRQHGSRLVVNVRLLDVFSAYYIVSNNAFRYEMPRADVMLLNVRTKEVLVLKKVVSNNLPDTGD